MFNKEDVLIVCALEIETQGQLEDWDVLYTGVGKVNATYKLTELFGTYHSRPAVRREYSLIINYGTAGSRKIKKGQLVDCTKFIQRDMDVMGLGFMKGETPFESEPPITIQSTSKFNPIGRNASCGSGDSFVEDRTQYYGEVVDMEAYALAKIIGVILIFRTIGIHFYLDYLGTWKIESSLPLHLCGLSAILSGLVLFWRKQLLYECLYFWGLAGAFHALLSPEFTNGTQGVLFYEYFLSHGGILLSALYLTVVFNMRPRQHSWIKIFLYTIICKSS